MKSSIPSTVMMMVTSKMEKRVFADARMMLMMCVIVVVMVMAMVPLTSAQTECGNVFGVYFQCGKYIEPEGQTTPPSQGCCDALKRSNTTCLCPYFAQYENTFSTEKVIYVLNYCNTPPASGTKCGNYTAP